MTEDLLFHGKERKGMHFHSRKRSGKGTMGFAMALVCAVVFLVLCIVSAAAGGAAGEAVGVIGMFVMAGSGVAFWLSWQGIKERDVYTRIPLIGMIVSGILFVLLFCLYISGIRF